MTVRLMPRFEQEARDQIASQMRDMVAMERQQRTSLAQMQEAIERASRERLEALEAFLGKAGAENLLRFAVELPDHAANIIRAFQHPMNTENPNGH